MSNPIDPQQERNAAILQALGSQYPPAQPEFGWSVPAQIPETAPTFPREEGRSTLAMAIWVLPDALLALGIALIWQLVVLFGVALIKGITSQKEMLTLIEDSTVMLMLAPSMSFGLVTMAAFRVRLLRRLPWSWFNLNTKDFWVNTGWGLAGGFAFLVVNVISGLIFQGLGSTSDQAEQMTKPFMEAPIWHIALFGLFVVFIGPLCEEIFFRGYVMRAILQRLGPWWGIILSAVMFSLPHAFGITTGFLGLLLSIFFGGVILGYVYYRTRSLWSAVVAHMLNNGLAFLGLLATIFGIGQ